MTQQTGATMIGVLRERVEEFGDQTFLKRRVEEKWEGVSWRRFHDWAMAFGAWLVKSGLKKGESVSILSQNRVEWVAADYGVIAAGGVTAAVYASNLPKDVLYIINHSSAKIVVVENKNQLLKVLEVLPEMPQVEHIVVFDLPDDVRHEKLVTFDAACRGGETADQNVIKELEKRIREAAPDDVATLIYTSGTTGPPKGAMLTQGNILFVCKHVSKLNLVSHDDETLSFLPLAHALERVVFHLSLYNAGTVSFARGIETLMEDIQEVKPTMMVSVPRVFEKIYDRVMSRVAGFSPAKRFIFQRALEVGGQVAALKNDSKPVPFHLAALNDICDKLVFNQIKQATGGQIRYFVSGGAPLAVEIIKFFHAVGLPILEAYGLTETTAPSTFNRPGCVRLGTVGQRLDEVDLKIADDGEILIRGGNIFKGYFKNEEATGQAIRDGWFHSGDIGAMSADGFLKITDRKKDLIITAGGKNVAPQNIENLFKMSPYISQMVVIGDRRPYLSALITLNAEEIERHAKEQGFNLAPGDPYCDHPRVQKLMEAVVAEKNRELAKFETIKKFRILPEDFTMESGELTPTLKVKRRVVNKNYTDLIEEMYAEKSK